MCFLVETIIREIKMVKISLDNLNVNSINFMLAQTTTQNMYLLKHLGIPMFKFVFNCELFKNLNRKL